MSALAAREVRINFATDLAVERARCFRAVIEADHADVNIRPSENPRPVALGEEDVAGFFDALQHFAVCAAANSLRRQQSGALALAFRQSARALSRTSSSKGPTAGRRDLS